MTRIGALIAPPLRSDLGDHHGVGLAYRHAGAAAETVLRPDRTRLVKDVEDIHRTKTGALLASIAEVGIDID
jgi:hypothetical protein